MPRLNRGRVLVAAVVLGATGTTTVATQAPANPSRNGGEIVFRRFLDVERTTGAIFRMNADGSRDRQLTQPLPGGIDDSPNWAPDGSRIVFSRQPAGEDADLKRAFWTVKPDGSDPKLLRPGCGGPPFCLGFEQQHNPLYSPDGRTIAYGWAAGDVREDIGSIQFSDVHVMNADGRHPRPLTTFTRDAPYSQDVGPAAWSPDGKHLLITRTMSLISEPPNGVALFIVKANGTGVRQVTPWALRAGGRADWSSDGRRIVFRTIPLDDVGGDIYTIRPDGFRPAPAHALPADRPAGRARVLGRRETDRVHHGRPRQQSRHVRHAYRRNACRADHPDRALRELAGLGARPQALADSRAPERLVRR